MDGRRPVKLPGAFDDFHDKISLSPRQRERIDSAATTLHDYLVGQLGVPPDAVFLQGSYPNGTAVQPADPDTGEYDVDLVAISASQTDTPEKALDDMEAVISASDRYAEMIDRDPKRPCVRLRYADDEVGGFHVDVVPARPCIADTAPLEIPRPSNGWHESAPREYTKWCKDQGARFARTVKMLKRWRDVNQTAHASIKSIVLQVLIAQHLPTPTISSDAEAVTRALEGIAATLSASPHTAPIVSNPVLPSENLAERWEDAAYRDFLRTVQEAAGIARAALDETNEAESHTLWRELFGEDFPPPPSSMRSVPPVPPPGARRAPQEAPKSVEWGL